jgi:hypothetical protein
MYYIEDDIEDFLSENHTEYVDESHDVEYLKDIEFFEKNAILDVGCFWKKRLTD